MRVFYGRAQDPHQQWAAEMTHGINTTSSNTAGELANPPPKTLFNQRKLDRKENIYASHIRAPLGISHEQSHGLPRGLNRDQFTFGIPTELGMLEINFLYNYIIPLNFFGIFYFSKLWLISYHTNFCFQ